MSDLTRYEQDLANQLHDLPLPDEDLAWDDMKQRLDKDKGKGAPPLPFNRNILWGVLTALVFTGAIGLFIRQKETAKTSKSDNTNLPNQNNTTVSGKIEKTENLNIKPNDRKNNSTQQYNKKDADESSLKGAKAVSSGTKASMGNSNDAKNNNTAFDKTKRETTVSTNNKNNSSQLVHKKDTNEPLLKDKEKLSGQDKKSTANSNNNVMGNSTQLEIAKNINKKDKLNNKKYTSVENKQTADNSTKYTHINPSGRQKNSNTSKSKSKSYRSAKNNDIDNSGVENATANSNIKNKQSLLSIKSTGVTFPYNRDTKRIAVHHTKNNKFSYASSNKFSSSETSNSLTNNKTKKKRSVNSSYNNSKRNVAVTKKGKFKLNVTNATIEHDDENLEVPIPVEKPDSTDSAKNSLSQKKSIVPENDTASKKQLAIVKPIDKKDSSSSITTVTKKKDSEKKLAIAVGIAEQQPIRINCDCIYPNNTYTKTSVADYIPSAYIRLYHNKWFIQAELKYAAPQYIKEFVYSNTIQNQPFNYITTSSVLKKVYYHQLPLSFNYSIKRNWSVGVGIVYNRFAGFVSQVDVRKKLYGTANDSLISSTTLTSNDSNAISFIKNNIQGLLETQYKWKRFSIGARYTLGLQPYVKYNDPSSGSPAQKTSNNALNIFIRYELFKF